VRIWLRESSPELAARVFGEPSEYDDAGKLDPDEMARSFSDLYQPLAREERYQVKACLEALLKRIGN
jgi:hypothetical protein